MPRQQRIEYEGAFYHVMARGDRQEAIFNDEKDREFFPSALGQACSKTGWRMHAWVLMGNHYHLVIETPEANLVAGMHWLQNAYTRRFNHRHRLCNEKRVSQHILTDCLMIIESRNAASAANRV